MPDAASTMVNESLTTRPPAFFVRMQPEVGCDPRVSVSADRLNGPPTSLGRPLVSPDFMGRDEPGHLTGRPRRAILEASFRKEQRRLIFRPIDDSQSRVTVGVGATQKRGPIFETGKRPGQRAYSKDGNLHLSGFTIRLSGSAQVAISVRVSNSIRLSSTEHSGCGRRRC